MIVNMQDLLKGLFEITIKNGSSSSEAHLMHLLAVQEFKRLQTSVEPNKQRKMISLFFGGTIFALLQEELKYGYDTGALAIARKTWEQVEPSNAGNEEACLGDMYHIGNYVLANLPHSLPNDLYTRRRVQSAEDKVKFTRSFPVKELDPLYPQLTRNIEQVMQLLQFYTQYKDIDLEALEFDDGVEVVNNQESSLNSREVPLVKKSEVNVSNPAPIPANRSEVSRKPAFGEDTSSEEFPEAHSSSCTPRTVNISMQVLGGFMLALGVTAVAVGVVMLSAASMGVVVGLGIGLSLAGLGLFAAGKYKNYKLESELNTSLIQDEDISGSYSNDGAGQ